MKNQTKAKSKVVEAAPPSLPVEGQGSEGGAPEKDGDGGGLTAAGDAPTTSNEAEKERTTEEKYVPGVLTNPDGTCKPNPNAESVETDVTGPSSFAPPAEDDDPVATVEARIAEAIGRVREQVRAEIRSEMLADPKVAGARAALESVKRLLLPYVVEADVSDLAAARAGDIAALKAQLAGITEERDQLARAVKDLGFGLLARQTLEGHPKAKAVIEGLGDLTRFADVKALNEALAPHCAEAKRLTEETASGSTAKVQRLTEDNRALSERVQRASDANKTLTRERDEALVKARTALVESYLERSISGIPQAVAIRADFKKLEVKSKQTVDQLVEAWKRRATEGRGTRDFDRIRRGLVPQRRAPSSVVEDSVRASLPAVRGERIHVGDGIELDVREVERLSGAG